MSEFEGRIGGVEKMTMLDFPGKIAAILFYNGCRTCHCPYCYNKEFWNGKAETMVAGEILSFLKKRKGVLDGVVFSGGECTTWGDELLDDIRLVRSMGYAVKVDTNGTNPQLIHKMLEEKLVDYYALDVKCPQKDWRKFYNGETNWNNFLMTLDSLLYAEVPFETRTTIHTDLTTEEDVNSILHMLEGMGYVGTHYLQFFFNNNKAEYLDPKINLEPRVFDLSKVIEPELIKVELRNASKNTVGEIR